MRVLLIQNCEVEGFGLYGEILADRGVAHDLVHAWRGDMLPLPGEHAAILVGGTPVSAADAGRHDHLRAVLRFLESTIAAKRPCLGICGGGQILARALGADVHRNRTTEIGGYDIRLTSDGREDPVFAGFPADFPVFHWHADTFDVPAGATLLAIGGTCRNQAFRHGNAVAVQFHLEVTAAEADRWAMAYPSDLKDLGKTRGDVISECKRREPAMSELADRLVTNVLEMVG